MCDDDDDTPLLGSCCICGSLGGVHNIIMLGRRAAVPGHGWGCMICNLPMDGASAVLCDGCLVGWQADKSILKTACRGYPGSDGRIAIADLPAGEFKHDERIIHHA